MNPEAMTPQNSDEYTVEEQEGVQGEREEQELNEKEEIEKEVGYIVTEEKESIEKDCRTAIHNDDNAHNSTTGTAVIPTVSKRGSLRLSFEAAMSLRRRNMSLKE